MGKERMSGRLGRDMAVIMKNRMINRMFIIWMSVKDLTFRMEYTFTAIA